MENEIIPKPRLIIILVMVTVVIFVGLVWLIATYRPWDLLAAQKSTSTGSALVDRDCTYPISYWRAHPELYPGQIIIGGMVYREFELEALLLDDTQDPVQLLKAQMAVAFLNGQAGADQSSIEAALFKAYAWLVQHPIGSQVSGEELEQGKQFFDLLEAYNLGQSGVAACEAVLLVTRTITSTQAATLEMSLTPSQTSTLTPSATPTTTELTVTSTSKYVSLTPTRTRTAEPPAPQATDTPKPPTPTNTTRPQDTPTFTPPPPPFTVTPPVETPP